MAGGKASRKKVNVAERRQLAIELRKSGASYRDIAEAIKAHGAANGMVVPKGYCGKTAYEDVMAALLSIRQQTMEDAQQVLIMELLRLDEMQAVCWRSLFPSPDDAEKPKMTPLDAMAMTLRIMERKDAMLGLSALGPAIFAELLEERRSQQRGEVSAEYKIVEVHLDHGGSQ